MPKKARAYWKGYLRLSLVSIGVEIYNAVESQVGNLVPPDPQAVRPPR